MRTLAMVMWLRRILFWMTPTTGQAEAPISEMRGCYDYAADEQQRHAKSVQFAVFRDAA